MFKKLTLPLLPIILFALILPAQASAAQTTVTPEQFGANGYDSTSDTEALQKAFNSGADIVYLKEGASYYIDKRLSVNKSIKITSGPKKAAIIQRSAKEGILYFRNPAKTTATASKNISKGSSFITAAATKDVKAGDIIELKSNKLWKWDNRGSLTKGEIHTVKSVSGSNIYLNTKTNDAYYIAKGEKVTVKTYAPNTLNLENINFAYTQPVNTTGIIIDPSVNSSFKKILVKNSKLTGLKLIKNVNSKVVAASITLGTTKDVNTGYGIQDYGGINTKILYSSFQQVRRGVDFSGDIPSRYGLVQYSKAIGPAKGTLASGNSGFGTHSTAEYIVFRNNEVKNFDYQFVSRGDHISFINNTGTGVSKAFMHTNYGDHITLANNKYISTNKSKLEYFILRSTSFKGAINHYGNKGLYQTYIR
ncbi:hypothetical protein [Bacillus infantis]|uniref:hypothetical protein n=1 Tax=Bacillus infantis TaxID=324767 RepID=UPI002155D6AF|nr:hypothetical protein [Bacillus infantis]MCR6612870.1 hypothetical protein [Bacillus infantis]